MTEKNNNSQSGIKIEAHLIQNFAPSNLNRDDTGQAKSAYFGGYRRARISSQCSKRNIRHRFHEEQVESVYESLRTRQLKMELERYLENHDKDDIDKVLTAFIEKFYSKLDKKDENKTAVLLFVSAEEIKEAVKIIKEKWDVLLSGKLENKDNKEIEERLKKAKSSSDIALFGRMLAENPERNIEAACQVAHPISTHKVDMEMDYYTAIDDLNPEGETGAGMIGVINYNSACYYRYACIDRDQLARNLSCKIEKKNGKWVEDLADNDYNAADIVIHAFLESMVYAIPTGKQNSFAAQNLPSFGLFVKRQKGVPVSLANAFAKPVYPTGRDDDLIGLSVQALSNHWVDLKKIYGEQGIQVISCFHLSMDDRLNDEFREACKDGNTVMEAVSKVTSSKNGN